MIRYWLVILLIGIAMMDRPAHAAQEVPRTLISLYDSKESVTLRFNLTHRFLEMPANHLGYTIRYHDVNQPLPPPGNDVHGIILWFYGHMAVPDADAYLAWLLKAGDAGKKIVVVESLGLSDRQLESSTTLQLYHALMNRLGIQDNLTWNPLTYQSSIHYQNPAIVGFERQYGPTLPPFGNTRVIADRAVSHLRVSPGKGMENVDLIVTNAHGGYVAPRYAMYMVDDSNISPANRKPELVQWHINPFTFLKEALATPFAPVPDVTTLAGRRIFYSHIDGDGWNNISEIPRYAKTQTIAADVMRREILEPYADFPFNVGLITADIDPECYGISQSEQVARDIFALPNVEPSSHTHSHPLFWRFFTDYTVNKEAPYIDKYPSPPSRRTSIIHDVTAYFSNPLATDTLPASNLRSMAKLGRADPSDAEVMKYDYPTPRSYACSPFDLQREISGSVAIINELSPPGKKAKLLQWSGDTIPFEAALTEAREAGLLNINGGDSRFDREYPSYAWVAPIGLQVGNERQIYSSNSNENTYTNLWTDRFFGFRYLKTTVDNTESPRRLSPFNLYFHIYSAQKHASLNALKENLNYARDQRLIPVTASQYVQIANSFYTTRIMQVKAYGWSVQNRGALQTLRFDNASDWAADMRESKGVLGYRHHQNNLYIALDPAHENPYISLINNNNHAKIPSVPYLIESNWQIKNLHTVKKSLIFEAAGYGKGMMQWQVAPAQDYELTISRGNERIFTSDVTADNAGVLQIDAADIAGIEPLNIELKIK